MPENLISELLKIVTFTPGVVAFAPADLAKMSVKLDKESWSESIFIKDDGAVKNVFLSIFINPEMKSSAIISELLSSIESFFKENNLKLGQFIVNIRGVDY